MILEQCDPLKGQVYNVVNEQGDVAKGATLPPPDLLKAFYRDMVRVRAVDDKAFKLQRQGRLGTYPQMRGHEAIQVGAAHAMKKEDWLVPSYREAALMMLHGVPFSQVLTYWGGNEMGSKIPDGVRCLPIAVPIASQLPHAVGLAWGAKLKKEKCAVLACFGDGATSEGEFHEAMNFAGVLKAPVVFLCSNNQWAISVPREKQTASKTIAQKAIAYGFNGICVDGMDIVAMYQVVSEALENARAGKGPTLIEAMTYRLCDHTTADNASLYQDPAETERWKARDGVERLHKLLVAKKLWSDADEQQLATDAQALVQQTVTTLESTPAQTPEDIFQYTYAAMTPRLQSQLTELKNFPHGNTHEH